MSLHPTNISYSRQLVIVKEPDPTKILCSPELWYPRRDKWGFIPWHGTLHRDEAQTEIDLKFHLLPLKCPKPFWKSDEHAPAYNMSVHMVRQHVT